MNAPQEGTFKERAMLDVLTELGFVVIPQRPDNPFEEIGSPVVHKNALYPHQRELDELCATLASHFLNDNIEVVIGAGCGGGILAHAIARNLSILGDREVHAVFAEKSVGTGFTMPPGFSGYLSKKRVLIVDEEMKRDGPAATSALMKYVEKLEGTLIGVGSICKRSGVNHEHFGRTPSFKLVSLITIAR